MIDNTCSRCLMNTSAEGIFFDKNNICNFCKDFEIKLKKSNLLNKNFNQLLIDISKRKKLQI